MNPMYLQKKRVAKVASNECDESKIWRIIEK